MAQKWLERFWKNGCRWRDGGLFIFLGKFVQFLLESFIMNKTVRWCFGES